MLSSFYQANYYFKCHPLAAILRKPMLPSLLSVTWVCIFGGNFQYLPLLYRLSLPLFLVLHKILNKMVPIPASKCQKKRKKVKIFATFSWIINEMPCKTTKKSPFGRLFCGLTRHLRTISPFCSMGRNFRPLSSLIIHKLVTKQLGVWGAL